VKKLTVVIVNWNGLENLKKIIPTLRKQTYKNFDILISDQGSTDGSQKWLKKNKIKFVENGRNTGFSGGANRGLKKVKTKYAALFNDDMRLEPNCLHLLMMTIEKDPNVGAVQALIANWDGSEIESTGLMVTYSSFIATKDKHKPFVRIINGPKKIDMASGGATVYRMDVLRKVGFFDEDFNPAYNEDADLSIRINKAGYNCMIHPSAIVYHKSGPSTHKLGYEGRLINHRNRYRLMRKHWTKKEWAKAWLWFPMVAGFFIVRKPDAAVFQATYEFLTGQLDKKKWKPK
jgi:GT2 family glycosyltransferase